MESFRKVRSGKMSTLRQQSKIMDVNSPLAKCDSEGNLKCLICKTAIKSAIVWKAHVNSKQHKLKLEAAKNLNLKKSNQHTTFESNLVTKPSDESAIVVKVDEFTLSEKQGTSHEVSKNTFIRPKDGVLPEKFFDDPFKDAKVRNIEYKNEQDDEWERFQKEIKDESIASNTIIAGELTEATVDRQIDEIDEQMHRWTRVINLEKKIKEMLEKEEVKNSINESSPNSHEDDEDDDNVFEEYLDWRSKKF